MRIDQQNRPPLAQDRRNWQNHLMVRALQKFSPSFGGPSTGTADDQRRALALIDEEIARRRTRRVRVGKKVEVEHLPGPQAQIALVALDPHTGEVLALTSRQSDGSSTSNALTATFEPASTATIFSASSLLAADLVTPPDGFFDPPGTR